jgi:hypothetical protein
VLHGHAPDGATTVVITFDDGAAPPIEVRPNGYFVSAYRGVQPETWRSITAYDDAGAVVGHFDLV